eukprot:5554879-Pyramimonas_sp.AAC.1
MGATGPRNKARGPRRAATGPRRAARGPRKADTGPRRAARSRFRNNMSWSPKRKHDPWAPECQQRGVMS